MENKTETIVHYVPVGKKRVQLIQEGCDLYLPIVPASEAIGLNGTSQKRMVNRDEYLSSLCRNPTGEASNSHARSLLSLRIDDACVWLMKAKMIDGADPELRMQLVQGLRNLITAHFAVAKQHDVRYRELYLKARAMNDHLQKASEYADQAKAERQAASQLKAEQDQIISEMNQGVQRIPYKGTLNTRTDRYLDGPENEEE